MPPRPLENPEGGSAEKMERERRNIPEKKIILLKRTQYKFRKTKMFGIY
jgi:hypothetical protein